MKKWLSALALVLVLILGACGGGEEEPAEENATEEPAGETEDEDGANKGGEMDDGGTVNADEAKQAFQANCASCHGGDLGGGVGPALKEVGSRYSAEEIVEIIHNGKGQMPAQKQVDDETAQLIASWLATMK